MRHTADVIHRLMLSLCITSAATVDTDSGHLTISFLLVDEPDSVLYHARVPACSISCHIAIVVQYSRL